jgi:hypothetical protein
MMMSMLSLLVLLPVSPVTSFGAGASADTLHCQVQATATGKRRCSVPVPAGRSIQPCTPAEAAAGHCDKTGDGHYAAWVVATENAKCKISRKRTDWTHKVTLSMSGRTPVGTPTCELYVALR